MNKKRGILAIACVLLTIILSIPIFNTFATSSNSWQGVNVTVNGNFVHFPDQQPIIVDDRVLVPVRGVFEHLGFNATWYTNTRIARLTNHNTVVIIPADINSFIVNSRIITPDVPQRMVNDRMMLPLRAVAEALGGTAYWDSHNRVARITNVSTTPTPTPTPTPLPSVTATFNPSPGHIPANESTVFSGPPGFTIPSFPTPTRVGYTFVGWMLNNVQVAAPFAVGHNVTFYASWTPTVTPTPTPTPIPPTPTPIPATPTPTPEPGTPTPTPPPGATPTPTPVPGTPTPTPPPGNPNHAPFEYTRSAIQIPNRRLSTAERTTWIAEYNSNGGASAFELALIERINQERESRGLNRLTMHPPLMLAARFYAQTLANLNLPVGSRVGPYERSLYVARAFGGSLRVSPESHQGWSGGIYNAGGWSYTYMVDNWMSNPNRSNFILSPNHRYIGFGSHLGGDREIVHYLFLSGWSGN